jgi:hypothetical protein
MLTAPIRIEPYAIYTDGELRILLGLTSRLMSRERRTGRLRHARRGRRTYYLGRWVLDWLEEAADDRHTDR